MQKFISGMKEKLYNFAAGSTFASAIPVAMLFVQGAGVPLLTKSLLIITCAASALACYVTGKSARIGLKDLFNGKVNKVVFGLGFATGAFISAAAIGTTLKMSNNEPNRARAQHSMLNQDFQKAQNGKHLVVGQRTIGVLPNAPKPKAP